MKYYIELKAECGEKRFKKNPKNYTEHIINQRKDQIDKLNAGLTAEKQRLSSLQNNNKKLKQAKLNHYNIQKRIA